MKEILERHSLHSKNLEKLDQPSLELQVIKLILYFILILLNNFRFSLNEIIFIQLVEDANYAKLSKEVAERTLQLRYFLIVKLYFIILFKF